MWKNYIPQTFNGASNSNKIGYDIKISLDLIHRPLISYSVKFTYLPGLEPLTVNNFSIIASTSIS